MHALDIFIAILGSVLIFIGIKRGLIGELIRLIAMVAGIFVAFLYYHDLARFSLFTKMPLQNEIRHGLAFIVIYLFCAVAIIALGWVIKKVVHCTPLGWIDRVLGALIGALKTFLIAYVACLSISSLPINRLHRDFNKSLVYKAYQSLPKALTLKSLLQKRSKMRTMGKRKPADNTTTLQKKIKNFKAVVDSAKEAQTSPKKD